MIHLNWKIPVYGASWTRSITPPAITVGNKILPPPDEASLHGSELFAEECAIDIFHALYVRYLYRVLGEIGMRENPLLRELDLLDQACIQLDTHIYLSRELAYNFVELFNRVADEMDRSRTIILSDIDHLDGMSAATKNAKRCIRGRISANQAESALSNLTENSTSAACNELAQLCDSIIACIKREDRHSAEELYKTIPHLLNKHYDNIYEQLVWLIKLGDGNLKMPLERRFQLLFRLVEDEQKFIDFIKEKRESFMLRLTTDLGNDFYAALPDPNTDAQTRAESLERICCNGVCGKRAKYLNLCEEYFGSNAPYHSCEAAERHSRSKREGCFGILVVDNARKDLAAFSGCWDEKRSSKTTPISSFFENRKTAYAEIINEITGQQSFQDEFILARLSEDNCYVSTNQANRAVIQLADLIANEEVMANRITKEDSKRMFSCVEKKLLAYAASHFAGAENGGNSGCMIVRFPCCIICDTAIMHYSSKGLFFIRRVVTSNNSHPTGEIEKLGFFNQVAEEIARRLKSERADDRSSPTELS